MNLGSTSTKSSACGCADRKSNTKALLGRPIKLNLLAGLLSSVACVMVPKCPACVAMYIMAFTGLGIATSVANYLRIGMLVVSASILLLTLTIGLVNSNASWLARTLNSKIRFQPTKT